MLELRRFGDQCLRLEDFGGDFTISALDVLDGKVETLCTLGTNVSTILSDMALGCSQDGKRLGYFYDGRFCTIDLESRAVSEQFECPKRHSLIPDSFDWNETGVCFLNLAGDSGANWPENRRLLVNRLDGTPSEVIATGPFAEARWLDEDEILVLVNEKELWKYSVSTKRGTHIFS